jgi:hypothetical protein
VPVAAVLVGPLLVAAVLVAPLLVAAVLVAPLLVAAVLVDEAAADALEDTIAVTAVSPMAERGAGMFTSGASYC